MASSSNSYTFVWADASIHKSKENVDLQNQILSVTSNFKPYEDILSCEKFIQSVLTEHDIVLIASGSFSKELVPKFHHLPQLDAVYVYCANKQFMEPWAKNYKKVKGIFVKPDEIIQRVRRDVRQLNDVQLSSNTNGIISIYQNEKKTVSDLNGDFIYSQLLIDILCKLPDDSSDKQNLRKMLLDDLEKSEEKDSTEYQKNKLAIERFVNSYQEEKAAVWYTMETNIYRQLNHAFTIQNVHNLFLFRHFIRDLFKHLEDQPYQFKEQLYRGQYMSTNEVSQLGKSLGKIISVNSFFSTSEERGTAEKFTKKTPSAKMERVLFIIFPSKNLRKTKPFTDISKFSKYQSEKEILFVPGSIFRIKKVQKEENNQSTIIFIELCSEDENPVQHVYEKMSRDLGTYTNDLDYLVVFGDLLYQISKYQLAEEIFIRLSKTPAVHKTKMIRVYYFLGMLAYHAEHYEKSLTYYHQGLEVIKANQSTNELNTVQLYNCIGEAYRALKNYDQALAWYKKLLDFCEKRPKAYQEVMAHAYNNIGLVYADKKEYGEALKYHYKSLEINENILEANHADIARNHHNIGIALDAMGQSQEAMKHYQKALEILEATLPTTHVAIGQTHQCIGCLHYGQKRWKNALESFKKAQNIYALAYGTEHSKFTKVQNDVARCDKMLKS